MYILKIFCTGPCDLDGSFETREKKNGTNGASCPDCRYFVLNNVNRRILLDLPLTSKVNKLPRKFKKKSLILALPMT